MSHDNDHCSYPAGDCVFRVDHVAEIDALKAEVAQFRQAMNLVASTPSADKKEIARLRDCMPLARFGKHALMCFDHLPMLCRSTAEKMGLVTYSMPSTYSDASLTPIALVEIPEDASE